MVSPHLRSSVFLIYAWVTLPLTLLSFLFSPDLGGVDADEGDAERLCSGSLRGPRVVQTIMNKP